MNRGPLVLGLIAIALLAPLEARADDVRPHIDRATQAHKEGRYDDARIALEAAFAIDPQPNLLYAIGQVHVKLDRCDKAIEFYEQFLSTLPPPSPEAAARQAIATCKQTLAAAGAPLPSEPPSTTPPAVTPVDGPTPIPTPAPPATANDAGPRPWYKDVLGDVLVGTGVVVSVIGVVMYRGATSDLDAAEAAITYQASEDLVDQARSKRTIAVIAGAGGVALITAGVLRYVMVRGNHERQTIAVTPTADGGVITWGGRF